VRVSFQSVHSHSLDRFASRLLFPVTMSGLNAELKASQDAKDVANATFLSRAVPTVLYQCPICMEDAANMEDPVSTACGHIFCEQCILTWVLRDRTGETLGCPMCRGNEHVMGVTVEAARRRQHEKGNPPPQVPFVCFDGRIAWGLRAPHRCTSPPPLTPEMVRQEAANQPTRTLPERRHWTVGTTLERGLDDSTFQERVRRTLAEDERKRRQESAAAGMSPRAIDAYRTVGGAISYELRSCTMQ